MKGSLVSATLPVLLCLSVVFIGCETSAPEREPPSVIATGTGVEMVLIRGGWFQMGSADEDQEDEAQHRVYVSPFYMDKHEVTQAEFKLVMSRDPSRWKGDSNPVEQIRWAWAAEYCNARSRRDGLETCYDLKTWACNYEASGYRLPTEAEWEYACRAGADTSFCFGDSPAKLATVAWFRENCSRGPRPVASKEPNPWGLHDMHGNVWEWCNDFYDKAYYRHAPERDPRGPPTGKTRVLRGGCCFSGPDECRSSYREHADPGYTDVCFGKDRHGFYGLRCVRRPPLAPAEP